MKPFQCRVFIIAVNRDMGDALVFEELDEIDGEEAFADAAFAIKDENQSFHGIVGLVCGSVRCAGRASVFHRYQNW